MVSVSRNYLSVSIPSVVVKGMRATWWRWKQGCDAKESSCCVSALSESSDCCRLSVCVIADQQLNMRGWIDVDVE